MLGKRVYALGIGLLLVSSAMITGVTGAVTTQDADVSFDTYNETVRVHPVESATISGETSLESGTEIQVIARSSNQSSGFINPENTTVTENGTFEVEMSFKRYENSVPHQFELVVRQNGTTLAEDTGKVVAMDTPVTSTSDESSNGTVPGFGFLVTGLAGSLGALLVSRRL